MVFKAQLSGAKFYGVLHRNRHIGASERRQLIPHVRSGSIFGAGKSIEIRLRMCGPPLQYTVHPLTKLSHKQKLNWLQQQCCRSGFVIESDRESLTGK